MRSIEQDNSSGWPAKKRVAQPFISLVLPELRRQGLSQMA